MQAQTTPAGNGPTRRDSAGAELAALREELASVERAWHTFVGPLTAAQFNWRPVAGRWSVGEHLAHLNLVDASYLPHLDSMIVKGRAAERVAGSRPARHPHFGRIFVRAMEPPVRLKVRTSAQYIPPSALDPDAVLADFAATRRALQERLAAAAGLDPGRVRGRFAPGIGPARLITLSLGQWFALTAAHDRRHLWLAERVLEAPGFPAS